MDFVCREFTLPSRLPGVVSGPDEERAFLSHKWAEGWRVYILQQATVHALAETKILGLTPTYDHPWTRGFDADYGGPCWGGFSG